VSKQFILQIKVVINAVSKTHWEFTIVVYSILFVFLKLLSCI